jgi:hypothetical protein
MTIEWNANAARLTAYQKAEIEAGRNPGDDGSGISFVAMDDTIYLIDPTSVDPVGVCRIVDDPIEYLAEGIDLIDGDQGDDEYDPKTKDRDPDEDDEG